MNLHLLPARTGGAAENMALDFLLLQRYPSASTPRFRSYGWRAPAFTFGYAQKIAFIRENLPPGEAFDLCRRPTGGGLVDHREDWTYALVIPRGHPLEEMRATQSYRVAHEALAAALRAQGVPACLKSFAGEQPDGLTPALRSGALDSHQASHGTGVELTGICFERTEVFDVVHADSGEKIAGAAQKRNKHGLLFQGSIWRPAAGAAMDWDRFEENFVAELGGALGGAAETVPWPDLNEEEVAGLTEQYSSPAWLEHP